MPRSRYSFELLFEIGSNKPLKRIPNCCPSAFKGFLPTAAQCLEHYTISDAAGFERYASVIVKFIK